ncbi:MAG: nuclear transport factor 2 family protein [Flavobacteriaceae bacterium]|nr:nuclear transport factor 2 family protein [Flavobacteriaceae bacterium]
MQKLIVLFIFSTIITTNAQVAEDSELFQTLKTQDSLLFSKGFNQCDTDYLKRVISEDLRFYHDQSGMQDKTAFFENVDRHICNDVEQKPIRQVDVTSLEVFPLYNDGVLYGGIQKGKHDFYIREQGKEDRWTSRARFTHVWVLKENIWKISEVLSYDHQNTR